MGKGLLPLASPLRAGERRALDAATALLVALVTVTGVHAAFGVGGSAVEQPIRDWVTSAIYILVGVIVCWRAVRSTEARRSWTIFAFGISIYGLGTCCGPRGSNTFPTRPSRRSATACG